MTDTCGCCSEELGATKMRDLLLENVRNLTADLQRSQGLLKEALDELADAVSYRDRYFQNWSDAEAKAERLDSERAAAMAEVERMRPVYEAAVRLPDAYGGKLVTPPGDWACKECKPESDWPHIENGWRCPVHALLSAIDTTTTKRGSHGG